MHRGVILIPGLFFAAAILAGAPCRAQAQVFPSKIPVTVTADKLDYDRTNDVYNAVGHVKIEQNGVRLEADKVVLDNKTGEAMAEGKVFLQDKGDIIHAEKLRINLTTREGSISDGDIFIKKDNLHVKGTSIERHSETVYHVEKGTVTTCDEDEWFLKADVLNIDMDRYATGRGVSFNVRGLPVLYTPYLLFPVRRQSGFLIPEPGYSTRDHTFINNAFFWAISDYKDMTIYSDYREKAGHGTGIEYRYRNSWESIGQMYVKYFDQYHSEVPRWDFRFQHQEEIAEDLSGRIDINLVSDERYFSDLDKKIEDSSKPYLDSNAFYVERWNNASLYLANQYSIDLTQTNEKTVQKLPELRYTMYDETIAGPLHLSFDGSAVNFTKQKEDGARRVDFNPRLTAAFGSSGLSFTPKAGVRATFYDRSANTVEPTERKFAYAGADINARVSRVYGIDEGAGIGRIRHSIEPTLSYSYIPHVDQESIPQFDSVDSVNKQNLATFALINRVTAHYKATKGAANYTTFDLMVFKLSRSYDFSVAREHSAARPGSAVLGELYLTAPKLLSMTVSGSYDAYERVVTTHSEGVSFSLAPVSLSLSHSYYQGGAEYMIAGAALALGKWSLSAQDWRDIQNNTTTQEQYLLHYGGQCWGLGLSYTHKPGDTQYMAMLDLKGFISRTFGETAPK